MAFCSCHRALKISVLGRCAVFAGLADGGQWRWSAPLPPGCGVPQHHAPARHQPLRIGRGKRGPKLQLPSRRRAPSSPPGKETAQRFCSICVIAFVCGCRQNKPCIAVLPPPCQACRAS
eukprot:1158152-Pelagomonas_calceolata.AAC.6